MDQNSPLGPTSTGLQPDAAALLSYLAWFITGILFYAMEKENRFVRFHAMQSIVTFGFFWTLIIILFFIPIVGWIILPFVMLASLMLWIFLMVKAYQGELFKLPIAGDIAEKNCR